MDKKTDFIVGGTVHPSSYKYCTPLPGIGTKVMPTAASYDQVNAKGGPIDKFARAAYGAIGKYFWDTYSG